MDCKKIIIEYLRSNGFDGLCEPETECGCGLDDFAPCCDGPYPQCRPATARRLAEGEFIGDGGPGDVAYFVTPNVKVQARTEAGESLPE
jgi:hypothetical protein